MVNLVLKAALGTSKRLPPLLALSSRNCSSTTQTETNIKYNSPATPVEPSSPVGPGASKTGEYKNPEYYCYNDQSYYDLETEMKDKRLPQPDADNEQF